MTAHSATFQALSHVACRPLPVSAPSALTGRLTTLSGNGNSDNVSLSNQNTTTCSFSVVLGESAQRTITEPKLLPSQAQVNQTVKDQLLILIKSSHRRKLSMEENSNKRQKCESTSDQNKRSNTLMELRSLQETRVRTFSHCPVQLVTFNKELIKAGFFHCNVGDRTICTYCNLICQQWNKDSDDPSEVHRILSPSCAYVLSHLTPGSTASSAVSNTGGSSFETGSSLLDITLVDQAIPGTSTSHRLGSSDFLWFLPIGDRPQRAITNVHRGNHFGNLDETLLTRLVAARLDLPVSQRMLTTGFKLSIIKRVWEDQLRLKGKRMKGLLTISNAAHFSRGWFC